MQENELTACPLSHMTICVSNACFLFTPVVCIHRIVCTTTMSSARPAPLCSLRPLSFIVLLHCSSSSRARGHRAAGDPERPGQRRAPRRRARRAAQQAQRLARHARPPAAAAAAACLPAAAVCGRLSPGRTRNRY